jgi:hypothetical protein
MSSNDLPILICTCDKTSDIAKHMLASLDKYLLSNENNLKIYVGSYLGDIFNNLIFLNTPQTNWKNETLFQLCEIRRMNPSSKNVLLILDDFLFKNFIDFNKILFLNNYMINNDLSHMSLKQSYDSFFRKIVDHFKFIKIDNHLSFSPLRPSHPYYFSLQVTIWNLDYLIESISKCTDIWNFEIMRQRNIKHYSVSKNMLDYEHIVEKGEWDYNAELICKKHIGFFNKGLRKFRKISFSEHIIIRFKAFLFPIIGYSFYRLKLLFRN